MSGKRRLGRAWAFLGILLLAAPLLAQQRVPVVSGSVTIPALSGHLSFVVPLDQNVSSFSFSGNPTLSGPVTVLFVQNSTGGWAVSGWASNINNTSAITISTTAGASTAVVFLYDPNSNTWTTTGGGGGGIGPVTDKGGQVYNVKAYGAVGNGVLLYNCSITTGTAALTCSTASFTSADVGKAIEVDGAAASAGNIVTTITAFTDATHVTIGSNASTTTSTANVVYGTDDSSAIQTLLNNVLAAGGGTLFFPTALYVLAGTPTSTNSMLEIPAQSTDGTVPRKTIGFAGGTPPNVISANGSPAISTGTLYGMEVVGAGNSVLIADPFSGSFSQINVAIRNLQIITPPNPNYILLRLNFAYDQTIENINLLANKPPNNALPPTPTTNSQAEGLQFGGNGGNGLASNVYVQGIYTGLAMQDHSICINCYAQSTNTGFLISGGSHSRDIFGGLVQNAIRGLDLRISTRIVAQVDFETNTNDIFTDGSNIKGFVVANDPGASIASKMNATSPFLMIQDENAGSIIGAFGNYPMNFATAPACAAGTEGQQRLFLDSTTATHGGTITGGGTNHVLGLCVGTTWVVAYP